MKKYFTILGMFFGICIHVISAQNQGVTIGAPVPPDPSAILDIQSVQGGVLPPRMSQTQRDAIANPAHGLIVFNSTTDCLQMYYQSIGWRDINCSCTQAPPQPLAISGPVLVCENSGGHVFEIQRVPGASQYQWTVPAGAVITSGGTDTSITVTFGQGVGNVSVSAMNYCGTSAFTTLQVTAQNPSAAFSVPSTTVGFGQSVQFQANTAGLNYQWTFTGGTPSTANTQQVTVQWASPGTYSAQLIVSNSAGCSDTVTQTITVLNCISGGSRTFTNCGVSGINGPSQANCNNTYGAGVVTVVNGIQYWTVPAGVCTITIDCRGAQGGGTGGGGKGARTVGTFSVTAGQVLGILVGQMGENSGSCGGGGGGSFVFNGSAPSTNNLMIAAGGGGGYGSNGTHSMDGQSGTTGGNSCNASGGTNGNGGSQFSSSNGGSGGGWLTNGGDGNYAYGGLSVLNGATGGQTKSSYSGSATYGGFGGGGGGHNNCEGGGGGGYSGGASGGHSGECRRGAGGGSFNSGTNPQNTSGFQTGHGTVIISW